MIKIDDFDATDIERILNNYHFNVYLAFFFSVFKIPRIFYFRFRFIVHLDCSHPFDTLYFPALFGIVVFQYFIGRKTEFYSVQWVANYKMLRTTDLIHNWAEGISVREKEISFFYFNVSQINIERLVDGNRIFFGCFRI